MDEQNFLATNSPEGLACPLPDLPVAALADDIVAGLAKTRRLILEAPTGSGKSTLVPRILLAHGPPSTRPSGQIVILQPRRLATRMLAARVASDLGEQPGALVGYQIRLDNVSSPKTRILFVTEGILLRRMLADPHLRGVSVLIFDEFHERHLHTDIALARALDIQETLRPDLSIVVMSATLETERLVSYLHPAHLVRSGGRTHPVTVSHIKKESPEPVWDLAARETKSVFKTAAQQGHTLIFMPGAYEIQRTIGALRAESDLARYPILPLHGELPSHVQDEAVAPSRHPKIIVATNVAETSVTIEGVTVVIDSGLARIAAYDPHRGINTLLVEKISRASADQRAGRAGRTAPGLCVRLWTLQDHAARRPCDEPEIRRLDLAEVVLVLKSCGVTDLTHFRWMDPPEPAALERAVKLLIALGALEPTQQTLTAVGNQMLRYPVHPRYGRMFVEAKKLGALRPVALAAALTQARSILLKTSDRHTLDRREEILETGATSDFEVLFRAFHFATKSNFHPGRCGELGIHAAQCRQVAAIAKQFERLACQEDIETIEGSSDETALSRCLLAGFPDHVAARMDGGTLRCSLTGGRRGTLARESVARSASLIVAAEVREIDVRNRLQVLLSLATGILVDDLREMHPAAVRETSKTYWEPALRRVVKQEVVLYHDLVVQTGRLSEPDPSDAARVLAEQISNGTVKLPGWDDSVEEWIQRLNWLCEAMPELGLTPITQVDRAALLEQLCFGATSERELTFAPVKEAVQGWINPVQRGLVDKFAPERLSLPSGRRVKIFYNEPGTTNPAIMATIQELYGVQGDLRIANGKVPLLIRILAPNRRPVQVASSLETFWRDVYPDLKAVLKRRYPKHEWR